MDKEKTLRKLKQEIEEVREKFGIEFAEVVRCKDCKHGTLCLNRAGADCVNCNLDDYSTRLPHDFCSYGERRDNDESLRIST